jgi:hypothetical protein
MLSLRASLDHVAQALAVLQARERARSAAAKSVTATPPKAQSDDKALVPAPPKAGDSLEQLSVSVLAQLHHLSAQLERAQRFVGTPHTVPFTFLSPICVRRTVLVLISFWLLFQLGGVQRARAASEDEDEPRAPNEVHVHFATTQTSVYVTPLPPFMLVLSTDTLCSVSGFCVQCDCGADGCRRALGRAVSGLSVAPFRHASHFS